MVGPTGRASHPEADAARLRIDQGSAKFRSWLTDGSGTDGTGPPIRLFSYSPSRSTATATGLYAGVREGAALMTDGYDVYDKVAQQ